MNELLELKDALPRAVDDALSAALDAPSDAPAGPMTIRIQGVDYAIEHGQVFTVAGLTTHGKSALRRRLERYADHGLVLMDAPFARLKSATRVRMQRALKSLLSEMRTTIVFLTDDCEEALALGDQVVIIRGTTMRPSG